ncbi:hypothetical protein [Streptomyces vinaceus]|uniref:hypothetical protein n=1 Tax=Streptomyces vinaceus TaxID=1960 RepID=UPI0036D16B6E
MTDSALSHQSLYWGSRTFAHSAMDAHAKREGEVFILHAGVSIERLAKATLSKTTPYLLLEGKQNENTLLHLAGVRPTKRVRTVGAADAIARLRLMGALSADVELDELIELRNGVAHLDGGDPVTFDIMAVFVRTVNLLLRHMDSDPAVYWGEWVGVVEIAVSEALEKTPREVARKIESARYLLDRRLRGLPEEAREVIYANAGSDGDLPGYGVSMMCGHYSYTSPGECPACGCVGRISTTIPNLGTVPEWAPLSRVFSCPLCGLGISGEEEMLAAGMSNGAFFADAEGCATDLSAKMFSRFIELGFLNAEEVENCILAIRRNGPSS